MPEEIKEKYLLEEIVEKYRSLYEKSDYIKLYLVLEKGSSELVELFNVGAPNEFPNHFIKVLVQKHRDEYLAVTHIARIRSKATANMSVDQQIIDWEKKLIRMYLAYEWIHIILEFCGRGFGDVRYTMKKDVEGLIRRLAWSTKHCAKYLSGFNLKMHNAIRKLIVSESALNEMLLRIDVETSSGILSLDVLKNYMHRDYTQAYEKVAWPLIREFAKENGIDKQIVESRLQEILGLS